MTSGWASGRCSTARNCSSPDRSSSKTPTSSAPSATGRCTTRRTFPHSLADDALATKSDLYILCPSDIPFEPDPLRYGGDQRESTDQYWIDLLDRFGLRYATLTSRDPVSRAEEATQLARETFDKHTLRYERVR
ncbi:MAG: hypothetical protein V9E94_13020 [Microthrixaceae bacterium]